MLLYKSYILDVVVLAVAGVVLSNGVVLPEKYTN